MLNHRYYPSYLVFIADIYQPVRFGVVRQASLAKMLGINKPGRFVLGRIGNITLVSSSFVGVKISYELDNITQNQYISNMIILF